MKTYCFRCGAEIPNKIKRQITKHGEIKGRCPSCKRTAVFVKKEIQISEEPKTPSCNVERIIQEEQDLLEEFNRNPLPNILGVLLEQHVGTEKEQKTALTGLLYMLRVIALKDRSGILKITGKSSAGKSHLLKTILELFPREWIKEIGDASGKALRYVEWKEERILVIKEASGGESSTETLKLMDSGDGGFTFLVTRGSVSDGFYAEEIKVPVKFVVTTSAKDIFDNELDNRMFGVSIDETDEQTFLILLHRCKEFAGHLPEPYYGIAKKFISELQEYDEIRVPYSYEFLNIVNRNIRARRDIDKILSLVQTSAFINQKNRPQMTQDGKRVLFSTPEDAYNIFNLAFGSFEETTTGFTSRMEQIYNVIPEGSSLTYRDIMKASKIGHKMQLIRELNKMEDLGLIDIDTSSNKHLVTRTDDIQRMKKDFDGHKKNFLVYTLLDLVLHQCDSPVSLSWVDISDEINRNKNRNRPSQETDVLQENRNKNRNKTVTKPREFYKNEDLEKYFGDGKNVEIVTPCYGLVTVCVTVSQQGKNGLKTAKCNTVTKSIGTNEKGTSIEITIDDNSHSSCDGVTVPSLNEKVQDCVQIIKQNEHSNYDLILEKYGQEFIDIGIERGVFYEALLGKKLEYLGGK